MAIVPTRKQDRDELELEATRLLGKAFQRISSSGALWAADGGRVLSMDQGGQYANPESSATPEDHADQVRAVMDSLDEARLSRQEHRVTEAVVDGSCVPTVHNGFKPVSDRLKITTANARSTWRYAKVKILENWAVNEDLLRSDRTSHRSREAGTGSKIIIGGYRPWGVPVDPEESRAAYQRYKDNPVPSSDWKQNPSMSPDGWQLGDDVFWGYL